MPLDALTSSLDAAAPSGRSVQRVFDFGPIPDRKFSGGRGPSPAAGGRYAGQRAFHSGQSAEGSVLAAYLRRGASVEAQRWRGKSGEIDLIVREGDTWVFVEVKAAARHDWAAERISDRQVGRIVGAATEFVGHLPSGQLTEMRFDLATVDGSGEVNLLPGALVAA